MSIDSIPDELFLQMLPQDEPPQPEQAQETAQPPAAPDLPNPGEPMQSGNHEPRTLDEAFSELARALPGSPW